MFGLGWPVRSNCAVFDYEGRVLLFSQMNLIYDTAILNCFSGLTLSLDFNGLHINFTGTVESWLIVHYVDLGVGRTFLISHFLVIILVAVEAGFIFLASYTRILFTVILI